MNSQENLEENEVEKKFKFNVKRGEIYMCDLGLIYGKRPVLVIQNDLGNLHSPRTIVAVLTSNTTFKGRPTHIYYTPKPTGIKSVIQFENIHTVDKEQLIFLMDSVEISEDMERALKVSLGLIFKEDETKEARTGSSEAIKVEPIKNDDKTVEIILEGDTFKEKNSIKIIIN